MLPVRYTGTKSLISILRGQGSLREEDSRERSASAAGAWRHWAALTHPMSAGLPNATIGGALLTFLYDVPAGMVSSGPAAQAGRRRWIGKRTTRTVFARCWPGPRRGVHPGSVYDAISARIAEDLGFEVGIFSGSIGSMTVLGAPDLIVLTLTEFAAQANRVCRAGNLCLLCDADDGYGNALNVRLHRSRSLETAGICAMSIEDTVLPRPYGP